MYIPLSLYFNVVSNSCCYAPEGGRDSCLSGVGFLTSQPVKPFHVSTIAQVILRLKSKGEALFETLLTTLHIYILTKLKLVTLKKCAPNLAYQTIQSDLTLLTCLKL